MLFTTTIYAYPRNNRYDIAINVIHCSLLFKNNRIKITCYLVVLNIYHELKHNPYNILFLLLIQECFMPLRHLRLISKTLLYSKYNDYYWDFDAISIIILGLNPVHVLIVRLVPQYFDFTFLCIFRLNSI